jgi:hypothetical protein
MCSFYRVGFLSSTGIIPVSVLLGKGTLGILAVSQQPTSSCDTARTPSGIVNLFIKTKNIDEL